MTIYSGMGVISHNAVVAPPSPKVVPPVRPILLLVRGLPGSGKSTFAEVFIDRHLCGRYPWQHFENDQYYYNDKGEYVFNAEEHLVASALCCHATFTALCKGISVVVSNTFISVRSMLPYIRFAQRINVSWHIVECKGLYDSIHGVPQTVISKMSEDWESADCLAKEKGATVGTDILIKILYGEE